MVLDPEVRAVLQAGDAPLHTLPVEQARRQMLVATQGLADPPPVETRDVVAELSDGVRLPLRIFRSTGRDGTPSPSTGALVYLHGGGFVVGSIATHAAYCGWLAAKSGVQVVSVDYRLAPEHLFPTAFEDTCAAAEWIAANHRELGIDLGRLGIGGDSAGGNLAACAAIELQQRGGPELRCQVLVYPMVEPDYDLASYRENGSGCGLTTETIRWFWDVYTPSPESRDQRVRPLLAHDLRGLPPALVLTAEHDALRDEGELYARRLGDSGVDVELLRYDGMIHGFVRRLRALSGARRALDDVATYLRKRLA